MAIIGYRVNVKAAKARFQLLRQSTISSRTSWNSYLSKGITLHKGYKMSREKAKN